MMGSSLVLWSAVRLDASGLELQQPWWYCYSVTGFWKPSGSRVRTLWVICIVFITGIKFTDMGMLQYCRKIVSLSPPPPPPWSYLSFFSAVLYWSLTHRYENTVYIFWPLCGIKCLCYLWKQMLAISNLLLLTVEIKEHYVLPSF